MRFTRRSSCFLAVRVSSSSAGSCWAASREAEAFFSSACARLRQAWLFGRLEYSASVHDVASRYAFCRAPDLDPEWRVFPQDIGVLSYWRVVCFHSMHDVGHGQHLTSTYVFGTLSSGKFAEHVMRQTVPSVTVIAASVKLAFIWHAPSVSSGAALLAQKRPQ